MAFRTRKNGPPLRARRFVSVGDWLSSAAEAIAAVDRLVAAGLERNLAGLAAFRADRVVHPALAVEAAAVVARMLLCISASLAALRLIGESFFGVELLLVGSEDELLSAVLADDGFVAVHEIPLR